MAYLNVDNDILWCVTIQSCMQSMNSKETQQEPQGPGVHHINSAVTIKTGHIAQVLHDLVQKRYKYYFGMNFMT